METLKLRASTGSHPIDVPRTTTLTDASEWLAPAMHEPLYDADGNDWWGPLKVELLNLARIWLDIKGAARLLDDSQAASLVSWRSDWWLPHLSKNVKVSVDRYGSKVAESRVLFSPQKGDLLKLHGRDLQVRKAMSLTQRSSKTKPDSGVAFLCEIPTPSMMDALMNVATPRDHVLTADPRALRVGHREGHPSSSLWAFRPERQIDARPLVSQLSSALAAVDPRFAALAIPGTRRVFGTLSEDLPRLETAIRRLGVRALGLASDQHRYGVIATWAAKTVGCTTVVFQHGLPIDPEGYTPTRADIIAVFGQGSGDWFENQPGNHSATAIIGYPRHRPVLRDVQGDMTSTTILVPLQPLGTIEQAQILQIVADIVQGAGGTVRCTLRLHPGDAEARNCAPDALLEKLGWPVAVPVRIDRSAAPAESLAAASVVVTHNSTMAVDAVVSRIPVVIYANHESQTPLAACGLPVFDTAAKLRQLLRDLGSPHATTTSLIAAGGDDAIGLARELMLRQRA